MQDKLKKLFKGKLSTETSKQKRLKRHQTIRSKLKTITWEDMQQIPAGEEDLIDVAVYMTMLVTKPVDLMSASEIKSAAFRNIYQGRHKEALKEIDLLMQKKNWENDFQYDLLICFWLAIHCEDVALTNRLMDYDIYLRQLVALAVKRKPEMPLGYKRPKEKFDLKSPGLRKRQSTKIRSPAKTRQSQLDIKEGGESEESQVGSEEDESEYDEEEEYDSEEYEEKELDWTKPNIVSSKLLEAIDSDEIEKETGINRYDENEAVGDNTDGLPTLLPPKIKFNDLNQEAFLKQIGVTGYDIEMVRIETEDDLRQIKDSLRLRFPVLMANIVKILLYRSEISLACTLTAYYEVSLDEEMIFSAIDHKHFEWLSYVWAFGKNYIGARRNKGTKLVFEDLFTALKEMKRNSKASAAQKFFVDTLKIVCKWYTFGDDDILRALLFHFQDEIVLEFCGYYKKFLTVPLFLYALQHGNKAFMQGALLMGAFDTQIFKEDEVIMALLAYFSDGSKTNYILNVLLLCDVTLWKNKWLKELINMFENFAGESYDKNRLMLSYNPMMSIALSADLLTKIGEGRRRFKDQCMNLKVDILELGKVFNSKIDDEDYYEKLIADKDFRNRTVLNIICNNNLSPLMHDSDPKAEDLIMEMWEGEEATRCDGNLFGYSNLAHILFKKSKKVTDPTTSYYSIISNYFEVNFKVDYTFQFRYRTKSIEFYFQNELFMSILLLGLFQYILNDFREAFKGPQQYWETTFNEDGTVNNTVLNQEVNGNPVSPLQDFVMVQPVDQVYDSAIKIQKMQTAHQQYNSWLYYVIVLCAAIVFSFIQKVVFNLFASVQKKPNIPIDKWQILDLINAASSFAFNVLITLTPTNQLDYALSPATKYYINYFCVFVSVIQFLRCFMLFLMISKLSKMLLTLQGVVSHSFSFLFLLAIFLFIVSAIFTSLYQNTNPDYFQTMHTTLVKMFNGMINFYDYLGNGASSVQTMFIIQLQVFVFNVILINYLIAVMATAYEQMSAAGSFMYKVNLFNYCERFLIAFNNEAYGEISLHPAPICFLTAPLTLCAFFVPQKYMPKVSLLSSYIIHWIENLIFLVVFAVFEIALTPFVYLKNIFIIAWASMGLFTTLFNVAGWIFAGPFFCLFIAGRDVINLAKIFAMQNGCKAAFGIKDELAEEEIDDNKEIEAYNGARNTVLEQYFEIRKAFYKSKDPNYEVREEDKIIDFDNLDVLQMLQDDEEKMFGDLDENEKDRARQIFVIKMTTIHDEWRKKMTKRIPVGESAKKDTTVNNQLQNMRKQKLEDNLIDKQGGMSEAIIRQMIDNQGNDEGEEQEEQEEIVLSADDILDRCVETFLNRFLIGSDKSTFLDNIDIVLMLKALPTPIVNFNMEQAKLFNFPVLQSAIIAFLNQDIVNSFEFFDLKNRDRVQIVRDLIIKQKTGLDTVESIMTEVKTKVQGSEAILIEFTEMWEQLQAEKRDIIDRELQTNYANQNATAASKKKKVQKKPGLK